MNHAYRLVWSDAAARFVPAPETAKGRGKSSGRGAAVVALCVALLASGAWAGPSGGSVSAGSGSISQSGATTTITQGSQNLAINWASFGIAAGERVNFVQPGASAIALNRVIGPESSVINGSLSANGQVWILNPNGVLFGNTASVNVGGLVASTLSLSDADFLAGKRSFSANGSQGTVVNQGSLSGGYVALLGKQASNSGTITTANGTAALAAGDKITLDFSGSRLLSVQVDEGTLNALAENKGLIRADNGTVILTASAKDALLNTVVNNEGVIEAKGIDAAGGTILLLGGFNGGTVKVAGTLDASASGAHDGGFIETSGAHVQVAGGAKVSTLSETGKTGTWLIDPVSMTIAGGTGSTADTLYEDTLEAAGSNVLIQATDTITASGTFGGGAVSLQPGVGLTIQTTGASGGTGIDLTGSTHGAALEFKTSGGGNVQLSTGNASQAIKASKLTVADTGTITIASAGGLDVSDTSLQTAGGAINLSGSAVKVAGSSVSAAGGNIVISAAGDSATHSVAITNSGATRSNVTTTGAGSITISGSLTSGGASAVGAPAGVAVAQSTISADTGAITITGSTSGSTASQETRGFRLDAGTTITSAGDIALAGTVTGHQPILPPPYFGTGSMGGEVANGATVSSTGGNVMLSGSLDAASHYTGTGLAVNGEVRSGASKKLVLAGSAITGAVLFPYFLGGAGTGLSMGSSSEVVAGTGGLDITGTVGSSTVSTNLVGVLLEGAVTSTGNIAIAGISNASSASGVKGVQLAGGSVSALGSATIAIRGTGVPAPAPPSSSDIAVVGTSVSTAGGEISLTGNRIKIDSSVDAGSGRTVIAPASNSRLITLGGNDEANALNLSVAELSNLTASLLQLRSVAGIDVGGGNSGTVTLASVPTLSLETSGAITQTAGLVVGQLQATGATVTLDNAANQIDAISGRSTSGAFQVTSGKAAPLTVGTVAGVAGIDSGTSATTLTNTHGAIVQTQAIVAGSFNGSSHGGMSLGLASNQIGAFAVSNGGTGDIVLRNGMAASFSAVANTGSGGIDVVNTGAITGAQAYTTSGAAGDISVSTTDTLDTANISVTTDAASVQTVSLTAGAGITVGSAFGNSQDALKLIATTGDIHVDGTLTAGQLTLSTSGTAVQTAAIKATGLELLGTGTHDLNHVDNAVGTLAGNTGQASYSQAGALAIGTVNTVGLTTTGKLLVRTTGSAGDLTLDNTVTSGSAASDALVLAAGRNFVNNAGASSLNAGAGRWLVWSGDPANDARGGLAYDFKQYNAVYGSTPVAQNSGNGFLYRLAPTVTASLTGSVGKTYDATTAATLSGASFSLSAGVDGDTVTLVTAAATGNYDNKNVGTAKTVTATGLGIGGASNGSATVYGYSLGSSSASGAIGTITKADLAVTGLVARDKTYDGSATATLTGTAAIAAFNGDSVTLDGAAAGAFADKNAGAGKSVSVTGNTLGGADAGNYNLVQPGGLTANIERASLTVNGATAASKTYDGTTAATLTGASLGGVVSGDTLSLSQNASFADKNAGTAKRVNATFALGGADAANYVLASSTVTTTADISAATLTVSGASAASKTYDGTTAATVSGGALSGVLGGDSVSFSQSGSFDSKNVGTGKTVTLGLSGADAGNYVVLGTVSASITPAALTVTANNDSRTANGSAYSGGNGVSYSGFVAGEGSGVLGGSLVYGGTSQGATTAGSYSIAASGLSASNYTLSYRDGTLVISAGGSGSGAGSSSQPTAAQQLAQQVAQQMASATANRQRDDGGSPADSSRLLRIESCGIAVDASTGPACDPVN